MAEEGSAGDGVTFAGDVPGHIVGSHGDHTLISGPDRRGLVHAGGSQVNGLVVPDRGEARTDQQDVARFWTMYQRGLQVVGGDGVELW